MHEEARLLLQATYAMHSGLLRHVVAVTRAHKWEVYTRQGGHYLRHITFRKGEVDGQAVTAEFERQCKTVAAQGGRRR